MLRFFTCVAAAGLVAAGPPAPQQAQERVVESMGMDHAHMHGDPHLRFTSTRPATAEDLARADRLARDLAGAIEKYRDYHVAVSDGYRQFLPNVPQPTYHFTNYVESFLEAFRFNPEKPPSLLYRKTADGFALDGAMFTAPRNATEEELNRRAPLSVATWHAHVNICVPPKGGAASADWTKFGPKGSIATKDACDAAGGRFYPQLFGWMVHVHPFEKTREKVWAH